MNDNTHMNWFGGRAGFTVDGAEYLSGIIDTDGCIRMYGFIERVTEAHDLTNWGKGEAYDLPKAKKAAAEKALMRFFEAGYILKDGEIQDMEMVCVLDADEQDEVYPYEPGKIPKTPDEVRAFFHPQFADE